MIQIVGAIRTGTQMPMHAAHPPPAAIKQPAAATIASGPVAAPKGKPKYHKLVC